MASSLSPPLAKISPANLEPLGRATFANLHPPAVHTPATPARGRSPPRRQRLAAASLPLIPRRTPSWNTKRRAQGQLAQGILIPQDHACLPSLAIQSLLSRLLHGIEAHGLHRVRHPPILPGVVTTCSCVLQNNLHSQANAAPVSANYPTTRNNIRPVRTVQVPEAPLHQSLLVALADEVPVNDLEERRYVFWPSVLIFQIVGMFPHIHP